MRLLPGGFIDTRLRCSEADLIYELPLRDSDSSVFVLLEHKSYWDPLTALQLHGYVGDTWEQHFRSRPRAGAWPLVIAIVVNHGAVP